MIITCHSGLLTEMFKVQACAIKSCQWSRPLCQCLPNPPPSLKGMKVALVLTVLIGKYRCHRNSFGSSAKSRLTLTHKVREEPRPRVAASRKIPSERLFSCITYTISPKTCSHQGCKRTAEHVTVRYVQHPLLVCSCPPRACVSNAQPVHVKHVNHMRPSGRTSTRPSVPESSRDDRKDPPSRLGLSDPTPDQFSFPHVPRRKT